jgi:predicted ATPase
MNTNLYISRIKVENFKSLVKCEFDLPKFSCLIGLNGSGKSTVLQFFDFLSQLVKGDMTGWLERRKWKYGDLKSKLLKKNNVEFRIEFHAENDETAGFWDATYSPIKNQCTRERFEFGKVVLQTTGGKVAIERQVNSETQEEESFPITFNYHGSILSALREEVLPVPIPECREFLRGIQSLDLLAPERLRQRTRESWGTLGLGGENLSAFLHELKPPERKKLIQNLQRAYPQLMNIDSTSLRSGWKQLEINERYDAAKIPAGLHSTIKTEARHVNDGMLRLIAILAELQSQHQFLLFDEIENGINPELVEFVLDELVNSPKQIMVTTHSPVILNYLEDEIARRGVVYLYKTPLGHTQAIPFFSIPSLKKKLEFMGPGEVFIDTNLTKLAAEIAEVTSSED